MRRVYTRTAAGVVVFLAGILVTRNFMFGHNGGIYVRNAMMPNIPFLGIGSQRPAAEDQTMTASRVATLHALSFKNTKKLMKFPDMETKLSKGFLNFYDITNNSSLSALDKQDCVNARFNRVCKICIYDSKKDVYISKSLRGGGQWEPLITNLLLNVLNHSKQLTFVDIGANIGYFSLLAASLGHYVVAVEPWEQHLKKFAQSIHTNNFQDKITVLRNAVSNYHRVGYLDIHSAEKRVNLGSIQLLNASSKGTITTSTIQLDDLAPLITTDEIIIKMDIEGHECRAIEKSNVIFDTFNVVLIIMEWGIMKQAMKKNNAVCPPDSITQMAEMLSNRGFVPYSYPKTVLNVTNSRDWTSMDVYWKPNKLV